MSEQSEFLERWEGEKQSHQAWADWLECNIKKHLGEEIHPALIDEFIKIPVKSRLKDNNSLLDKAFYRKKDKYKDPYNEITDKVGMRFVVLLGTNIEKVKKAVNNLNGCTISPDVDYKKEHDKNPLQFDYAAVHYTIKPIKQFELNGITIPINTCCEIQIKTLLQHAYSELTHDRIYKTQIEVTPNMLRDTAKAMALLEATNDYFEKVAQSVNKLLSNVRKMTTDLTTLYKEFLGTKPQPTSLEGLLLDAYDKDLPEDYIFEIHTFFTKYPAYIEGIKTQISEKNLIFKQPSILLVYWKTKQIYNNYLNPLDTWPLTKDELRPIAIDLGISLNNLS